VKFLRKPTSSTTNKCVRCGEWCGKTKFLTKRRQGSISKDSIFMKSFPITSSRRSKLMMKKQTSIPISRVSYRKRKISYLIYVITLGFNTSQRKASQAAGKTTNKRWKLPQQQSHVLLLPFPRSKSLSFPHSIGMLFVVLVRLFVAAASCASVIT